MPSSYTSLLGLVLPVTGDLSGTWGDTVNNGLTSLVDSAVAGTTTLSTDADVTLTTTTGSANQSRQAIILWTASGTVTRTITAPAQSKVYTVINNSGSTQSIKLVGVGPTTGVTILKGEAAVCAWNGSDFIKIGNYNGSGVFSSLTDTALTSGRVTYAGTGGLLQDSANLTFNGTTLTAAGFSGPIGASSSSTGSFTTLTASSTVSGVGFTNYFASPPPIGSTAQNPGYFTGLRMYGSSSGYVGFQGASAAGSTTYTLPTADGTNGQSLTTNGSGVLSWATTTSTPGGSTTQVQYNNGGAFAGSANMTFNGTTLTVAGLSGPLTGTVGATTQNTGYFTTLRMYGSGSGYVGFQGAAAAGSTTYTLPAADGTTGQSLTTNGSGTLSWATATGTPGGSTTQVQFNNAGVFGGSSNLTFNGTTLTAAGLAGPLTGTVGATTQNTGYFTGLRMYGSSSGYVGFQSAAAAGSTTYTLPAADGANGQSLTTNGSGTLSWSTASGTPGGSTTQVQFNNGGVFAGSASMTFDGTTLTVAGLAGPLTGTVGATSPNTGAFTTLSASSTVSGVGFSNYFASPPAIGSTSANSGAFTSLSASGTVSGTGFSTYLASPPAIGSTAQSTGYFTVLRMYGSSSGYVGFQGAAAAGSTTYTLPSADGTTGQALTTNGSGTLAWTTVGGGGTPGGSNTQVQFNSSGSFAGSANLTFDGTTLTAAGFADSSLTSGRVTYASTGGNLTDSANLTFDGTTLTATGFAGPLNGTVGTTTQNTGYFTTLRMYGSSSGYVGFQGAAAAGSTTYTLPAADGTNGQVLSTNGSGTLSWATAGGGGGSVTISNDTATTSDLYPAFVSATSGTASTLNTSNAKLLYKPSTGELKASEMVATNGIIVNSATVSASYTIESGNNGFSVGPMTVSSGATVTVTSGQQWVVI